VAVNNYEREIVILCTRKGIPNYIRCPISLRKKVKRMFDLEHTKESPNPLGDNGIYFYVGWDILSPHQQKMALEIFRQVP